MASQPRSKKRLHDKADSVVTAHANPRPPSEYPLLIATALAVAVPLTWAYQQPPLPAFYSQLVAGALWSLVLLLFSHSLRRVLWAGDGRNAMSSGMPLRALWVCLLTLAVAHGVLALSPAFIVAPVIFNLALAGLITLAVLLSGNAPELQRRWLGALLVGVLLAALFNSFVSLLQAFAPNWTNDIWIASSAAPHDRASGNLRQPNQLATLMVWGVLAATFLLRIGAPLWLLACAPLAATLFATGSRTGVISLALIVIVALLRSSRVRSWRRRSWLLLVVAVMPLAWFAASVFTRSTADAAMSQRLALWRDVLELIRQHPWTGVGIGQLNFAWTLTPLAARAPDVFDHAHSLPLQLAVELGLPAAVIILVLLATVLWRARAAMRTRAGATAALMLAVVLVHSLFEYPLWFSYFLLPSAFLLAWLARSATADATPAQAEKNATTLSRYRLQKALPAVFAIAAVCLLVALSFAMREYDKAVAIHRRTSSPVGLSVAVDAARASPLFGQFGDYAAIMLAGDSAPLAWFERPIRNVLDERLLAAYANALARAGDYGRAVFVVARAREFPPNHLFDTLPAVTQPMAPGAAASAPIGPRDFRR